MVLVAMIGGQKVVPSFRYILNIDEAWKAVVGLEVVLIQVSSRVVKGAFRKDFSPLLLPLLAWYRVIGDINVRADFIEVSEKDEEINRPSIACEEKILSN